MNNIILFGPPGCGKGTQSALLVEKYKLKHLATGDLLRAEIASDSTFGRQAQKFIEKGKLVTDELVISIIEKNIQQNLHTEGFLFDGFPRTSPQAEMLDQILAKFGHKVQVAIFLEVNRKELIRRILERSKTSNRIDDSDPAIIENRLAEYQSKTSTLKEYYQDKIYTIDGLQTIEKVFGEICHIIKTQQENP